MSPSLTGDPMAGPVEEEKGRRGGYTCTCGKWENRIITTKLTLN